MRISTLLLSFVLVVLSSAGTIAQTISLAVDSDGELTRSFDIVTGEEFDVVTLVNTDGNEIAGLEWVQTELLGLVPGIFKLATVRLCGTCDCFGCEEYAGEYVESLGGCWPSSSELEVLRITYLDFQGSVGSDLVLAVRGIMPGDHWPSSFNGSPGFIDCNDAKFPLVMSGGDAWQTGSGVVVPSGAAVLNPTPPLVVGATDRALSRIKAMYR